MSRKPVLELTTTSDAPRPLVRINGKNYEMRTVRDLSIPNTRALARVLPRLSVLVERDQLTAAEGKELGTLLDEALPIALDAPPAVLAQLGEVDGLRVIDAFTDGAARAGLLDLFAVTGARPSDARPPRRRRK